MHYCLFNLIHYLTHNFFPHLFTIIGFVRQYISIIKLFERKTMISKLKLHFVFRCAVDYMMSINHNISIFNIFSFNIVHNHNLCRLHGSTIMKTLPGRYGTYLGTAGFCKRLSKIELNYSYALLFFSNAKQNAKFNLRKNNIIIIR